MLSRMTEADARRQSNVSRFRDLARGPAETADGERELLLDGLHLLSEAHASGTPIDIAAFDHAVLDDPSVRMLAETLSASGVDVLIVSRKTLEAMSPVKTPTGAVAIARRPITPVRDALAAGRPALALLAVDVQDPGNVGALIRTAEAAGATAFIACGGTADPFGWKALRGSMGSALRLPIAREKILETVLRECSADGIATVALASHGGKTLFDDQFRGPTALLLGSEGAGLSPDITKRADRRISIPMQAPVESLNVGVAAALVLYEAFRQRMKT